jgi:hypothetical protein
MEFDHQKVGNSIPSSSKRYISEVIHSLCGAAFGEADFCRYLTSLAERIIDERQSVMITSLMSKDLGQ